MEKRGSFGSRFGAVAAVGGSVIGLGNIWRFPYIAGENGGAVFILIYLSISFLISIPIMLSEFSIGRAARRNSMGAFARLAPGTQWKWIGYAGIITAFIILSFYCVIGGWAFEFLKESVLNQFQGKTPEQIEASFKGFIACGWRPIIWTVLFIIASTAIILAGVQQGIERYTKILMPILFVLLLGLAINSLTLEGAQKGVTFLLKPDFSKVSGSTILQALGQSFFSMSLGMGAMITYGSYLRKEEKMMKVGALVALSDITVAILSGLAIFPAVFSFGINPSSGPDLVFLTLPNIFTQMSGGHLLSIIFFFLLFIAAITSSISLLEVIVAYMTEELHITRKRAIAYTASAICVTGSLCALSMIPNSILTVDGKSLFDLCDSLSSNILMPLGALFIVLFAGWILSPIKLRNEMTNHLQYGITIFPVIRFMIRFVIPVVILLLFLNQIGLFGRLP